MGVVRRISSDVTLPETPKGSAREACREVMEPTQYDGYRAVLVPDCVVEIRRRSRG
jgi:hypothetical protein